MRLLWQIPLKTRILVLVALGMVVILGSFSYFSLSAMNESTQRTLDERLALTRQIAINLDSVLLQTFEQIETNGRIEGVNLDDTNPLPEKVMLRNIYDNLPLQALYVSLLDKNGRARATEPAAALPAVDAMDPHVVSSVSNGALAVTNMSYDVATQNQVVYLVSPLYDSQGQFAALVEVAVDLSHSDLERFLRPGSLGQTGYAQIVDGNATILATTERRQFLKESDHKGVLAGWIKDKKTAVSTCHRCHQSLEGGISREREIITFAPLSLAPWGVVLRQQEAEALAPTRSLGNRFLFLGGFSLLVTIVLAWVTTESVTRPIRTLTTASQKIARGNLSERITISGKDEVGTLAENFDVMRTRLKESLERMEVRAKELEVLNGISAVMNQSMDLDTILSSVLSKVMNLVNGELGGILMLDEASQTLSYRAHRGFSDKFLEGTANLRVGEGIAGTVVQTGEPALVDDVSKDPRLTRPVVSEEGLRSSLSIPIHAKDKVVGVLNVASREPRLFSSQDMRLLSAIGNQLGVAIERAKLYDELQHKEKARGELLGRIISAQEEERKRIARDLHDETSQTLTALTMSLEAVAKVPSSDPGVLRASLRRIQDMATMTLEDVHRVIFDLRPSLLDDLGLIPAVKWYARDRLEHRGTDVDVETSGSERRLPVETEAAVFRIVQEAVSNVAQHSSATRARISLGFKPDSFVLTVEDNGRGFDSEKVSRSADMGKGFGLMGMKERAELLGGILNIRSRPGAGTQLVLEIPAKWERPSDAED